jgi:hypothetical protein
MTHVPTLAVYEVVKKKEAEKRAAARIEQAEGAEPSFGAIVRQQWEERKRELQKKGQEGS